MPAFLVSGHDLHHPSHSQHCKTLRLKLLRFSQCFQMVPSFKVFLKSLKRITAVDNFHVNGKHVIGP